jgi:polysaccharide biosynthesis/export protein
MHEHGWAVPGSKALYCLGEDGLTDARLGYGAGQGTMNAMAGMRQDLKDRTRVGSRWASVAVWGLILASTGGCVQTLQAPFVWVDEWREPLAFSNDEYVIGVGDLLNVQVWDQEKMSGRVRVRSDGRVSLPFVDDVPAVDMAPVALARSLEERLKEFIVTPQVTVVVEEARPLSISVLGQVAEPGLYNLEPGARIAQALAAAGGLRDFARKDGIYLVRSGDGTSRIRMTYNDVTARTGRAFSIRLRSGDIVVVE